MAAIVALAIVVPAANGATRSDPERDAWQHRLIGHAAGAPVFIRAIAQTPDGFVWLGAADGLYRYDGLRFERLPPSSDRPLQSENIASLAAMPNGDLWVGHDWGGISLVRRGRHVAVDAPGLSTVSFIVANRRGDAWAVSLHGQRPMASRLVRGRWSPWATAPVSGYISQASTGADGGLWLIVQGHLLSVSVDRRVMREVGSGSFPGASLSVDGRGRVWLLARNRLYPLSAGAARPIGEPLKVAHGVGGGALAFERGDAFWTAEGIQRLRRYVFDAPSGAFRPSGDWKSPFSLADAGLDPHDLPMLYDREGTLLVGTSLGLLKLRRPAFAQILGTTADGPGSATPPYALADGRGDVWLKRGEELFKASAEGRPIRQAVRLPIAYTPCGGTDGGLWVPAGRDDLVVLGGSPGRRIRYPAPRLLGTNPYGHCVEDLHGNLWANEANRILRLGRRGGPVDLGADNGSTTLNMIADRDGGIVAYVGRGSVWSIHAGRAAVLWPQRSMTLGMVEVMYQAPRYLLLGGDRGLVRYREGGFESVSADRRPEFAQITGIAQTRQGDTWLQGARGLVRMRTADLDRVFSDPGFAPSIRLYGEEDGLPGSLPFLNMSSLTADRQGRVYVTTNNGVARYDPGEPASPPVRLRVVLTDVEADGRHYDASRQVTLPAGTSRLQASFTAPSTRDPAGLRFRYRLAGMDRGWVDAEATRVATYTQLAPGTYRFEVEVSDGGERWSGPATGVGVRLPPLFYQTGWFLAACTAMCVLAMWLGYRSRLNAVAQRLRHSAADRARERERIARDIHDTLLQSVQGVVLRFQAVASRLAPDDPVRAQLERTLDRADESIAEGKNLVLGLRRTGPAPDVLATIRQALDETPFHADVTRTLIARGQARAVVAQVAEELREMVGEALFNVARHAHARSVRIEVAFGPRRLDIVVADDGVGFEAGPGPGRGVEGARGGFGLAGMRERAEQIAATIDVTSQIVQGTTVRIRIPARAAYAARRPRFWPFAV